MEDCVEGCVRFIASRSILSMMMGRCWREGLGWNGKVGLEKTGQVRL